MQNQSQKEKPKSKADKLKLILLHGHCSDILMGVYLYLNFGTATEAQAHENSAGQN
jgi:hypothetical protein